MNYYWAIPADGGGSPELIVPTAHTPVGKRAGDGPAISPDGNVDRVRLERISLRDAD